MRAALTHLWRTLAVTFWVVVLSGLAVAVWGDSWLALGVGAAAGLAVGLWAVFGEQIDRLE